MKPLTMIVIIFISAAFLMAVSFIGNSHTPDVPKLSNTPLHSYGESFNSVMNGFGIKDSPDKDMTYAPHGVTFHLHPEREGVSIVAWASDSLPPTTGYTDKKSEVTLNLLGTVKYNILIDQNRCSYYIYPTNTYYNLECKW